MSIYQSSLLKSKFTAEMFTLSYWDKDQHSTLLSGGRGGSIKISIDGQSFVLKKYLRGGLIAKILKNKYLWLGNARTRPYLERAILEYAYQQGLPVPVLAAYHVERKGCFYQATIITQFISNIGTLASYLEHTALNDKEWLALASVIKQFHHAKINHVDLNADNILLYRNEGGLNFSVIDFDKAKIEKFSKQWPLINIMRLQRSLFKINPKYFNHEAQAYFKEAFEV